MKIKLLTSAIFITSFSALAQACPNPSPEAYIGAEVILSKILSDGLVKGPAKTYVEETLHGDDPSIRYSIECIEAKEGGLGYAPLDIVLGKYDDTGKRISGITIEASIFHDGTIASVAVI